MSLVRVRGTAPEQRVRHVLRSLGVRYRGNASALPGRPDLVIPELQTAIFVHGCFWHRHLGCPKGRLPATNREFWDAKITETARRDKRQRTLLRKRGWDVLTLWECRTRDALRLERILARRLGLNKTTSAR